MEANTVSVEEINTDMSVNSAENISLKSLYRHPGIKKELLDWRNAFTVREAIAKSQLAGEYYTVIELAAGGVVRLRQCACISVALSKTAWTSFLVCEAPVMAISAVREVAIESVE